jgi:hypothetical protein
MKHPSGFVAALALGICCGFIPVPQAQRAQFRVASEDRVETWFANPEMSDELTQARYLRIPTAAELKVDRALASRVSYDFREAPLSDVISSFEKQAEVPFWIDRTMIQDEGILWDGVRITAAENGIVLRDALDTLLRPNWLMAVKNDDEIAVTSAVTNCQWPFPKIYPVADLITVPIAGGMEMRHDELIDLIKSTIEPGMWDHWGGDSSIRFDPMTLSFRISQMSGYHLEIEELLARLRQKRRQAMLAGTVRRSNSALRSDEIMARHRQELVFVKRDLQELESMEAWKFPLGYSGQSGFGIFNVDGNNNDNDDADPSPNEYGSPTWYQIAARARRLSLRAMLVALEVAEAK